MSGSFLLAAAARLLAGSPTFPEFHGEDAHKYLSTVAEQALLQAGTNADTCLISAKALFNLGETAESERLARRALDFNPRRADAQFFLARLLVREDRTQEAIQCLREAVRLDSKMTGAYRLLGMALERIGDQKGAEDALESGLRSSPEDSETELILGRFLLDQGRSKDAIAHLVNACRFDPQSANARYVLYQAQSNAGETNAAQVSLRKFQELKGAEKNRTAAMESNLTDEKKIREYAAGFHNEMAIVLQRAGRTGEAEAQLKQAIRVAPDHPLAYQRLAAVCERAGRLPEEKEYLSTLVQLKPNELGFKVNLGTVLLQLKEYPAAIQQFQAVLSVEPDQPQALNNLARYYLSSRQQLPEALSLTRRLLTRTPSAENYDLLAWALYANGKTNEAIEASSEAVRLDPTNPVYAERRRRLEQAAGAQH